MSSHKTTNQTVFTYGDKLGAYFQDILNGLYPALVLSKCPKITPVQMILFIMTLIYRDFTKKI